MLFDEFDKDVNFAYYPLGKKGVVNLKYAIIYLCFFISYHGYSFNWLAFGDLRGHLDSCGCDPKTDLGGVDRLGVLLDREKAVYKDVLVFSLGNLLSPNKILTTEDLFILKAMETIKPHGCLPGEIELQNQVKMDCQILSNGPGFKPFWKNDQVMVWGYTEQKHLVYFSPKLLAQWKKEWSQSSHPLKKVLLFSGPDYTLKAIQKTQFFDLIISGNSKPIHAMIDQSEKQNPKTIERIPGVFMVPLGGNGVLRGGDLQRSVTDRAFKVKEPLQALSIKGVGEGTQSFLTFEDYHPVSWLDSSYEGQGSLQTVFQDYQKASQASFEKLVTQRLEGLKTSPYAGAQSCQSCHKEAYEIWSQSKHAKAYPTLEAVHQEKNPSCIGCHVVGFSQTGGFVSKEHSPHLAGVQCETCHGPRKDHVKHPVKAPKKPLGLGVCSECHHQPHSADFDAKIHWEKIRHGAR